LFKKQNKIYYVLPTTLLTIHTFERFQKLLEKFCEVFGICKKKMYEEVLLYHGNLTTKQKKEIKEKIKIGQFKILFTTTNFLYRNFEVLEPNIGKFQFIFVDDVDSLLKTAKNIDYILRLMGFSEDAIQLALEIVKLKVQLPFLKGSKLEETLDKLNKLRQKLAKYKEKIKTILVASSATAKPKGIKIKILGELLDFEV
jgi:reverse gyrase